MPVIVEPLSIDFCDANRQPLQIDENSGGFLARFRPSPRGTTGQLFLRVTCRFRPQTSPQIRYVLDLRNLLHYRFNGGDGGSITFFRNAESGRAIFLPVEIQNKIALSNALPADMMLFIRDSAPGNTNEPQRIIRIKGFN